MDGQAKRPWFGLRAKISVGSARPAKKPADLANRSENLLDLVKVKGPGWVLMRSCILVEKIK